MDTSTNSVINSLWEVLTWQLIVSLTVFYCTVLAAYRIFWHPLSHIPGPKLAALTIWYEGFFDLFQGGKYTFKIAELHEKYGEMSFVAGPCRRTTSI
jgi:hypothetical protein